MIPNTKNDMPTMVLVSAMQKAIRRGMEEEALSFAVEVMRTSKPFHSLICNRLEVICHEDLDTLAAPWVTVFVATAIAQSKERYAKFGEARLMIANCIRMMCRAPKSRAGCHFGAAVGLRAELEGYKPTIPDWAYDQHTGKGRAMGRGIKHFRAVGAVLNPPPTEPDPYEERAYALWAKKQGEEE